MKCEFCGHALGTHDAYCHNCGRLISKDQMAERKKMNGAMNPYAKRLSELNKNSDRYKIDEEDYTSNKKNMAYILIVILLVIVLIAILKYALG